MIILPNSSQLGANFGVRSLAFSDDNRALAITAGTEVWVYHQECDLFSEETQRKFAAKKSSGGAASAGAASSSSSSSNHNANANTEIDSWRPPPFEQATDSWKKIFVCAEHTETVSSVDISSKGELLTCSYDRNAYVWRKKKTRKKVKNDKIVDVVVEKCESPGFGNTPISMAGSPVIADGGNDEKKKKRKKKKSNALKREGSAISSISEKDGNQDGTNVKLAIRGSSEEGGSESGDSDSEYSEDEDDYDFEFFEIEYEPVLVELNASHACNSARWSPGATKFCVAVVTGDVIICCWSQANGCWVPKKITVKNDMYNSFMLNSRFGTLSSQMALGGTSSSSTSAFKFENSGDVQMGGAGNENSNNENSNTGGAGGSPMGPAFGGGEDRNAKSGNNNSSNNSSQDRLIKLPASEYPDANTYFKGWDASNPNPIDPSSPYPPLALSWCGNFFVAVGGVDMRTRLLSAYLKNYDMSVSPEECYDGFDGADDPGLGLPGENAMTVLMVRTIRGWGCRVRML
jgi:hypothetical protein